jgi:imidazolonepropionase-like amidohydrolase
MAQTEKIALTRVRIFDSRRLLDPGTVVIENGTIGGDAHGARVIDGRGGVLLPGLIDAHVHLHGPQTLEQLARFGVTTALDMGTWPASLVASLREQAGVTDIRSSGVGATSPRSRHAGLVPGRPLDGLVGDPRSAQKYVADRVAEGADYIKIIIDLPGFDQETVGALAAAARASGKKTIAHAATFDAVSMAQRAGVDAVTHAPLDRALDEASVSAMAGAGRIAIPTLTMMEQIVANISAHGPSYEPARTSVAALHRAGVPVLAGTDANNATGVPASPEHGSSMHRELELLVAAGLTPAEALRAATVLPARYFGLPDRGVIEAGKRADLMLIAGDPLADIGATRQIERVWCTGIEYCDPRS